MASPATDRLVVLIDADNAQPAVASDLLAEVAKYGTATVKRAYGDWTTTNLAGWKETLHNLAIQPIQQFPVTVRDAPRIYTLPGAIRETCDLSAPTFLAMPR